MITVVDLHFKKTKACIKHTTKHIFRPYMHKKTFNNLFTRINFDRSIYRLFFQTRVTAIIDATYIVD